MDVDLQVVLYRTIQIFIHYIINHSSLHADQHMNNAKKNNRKIVKF